NASSKNPDWLVPHRAGTGFWWRPPVASSNDVVRIARRGILHDLSRWDQIRETTRFVHLPDIAERISAMHHKIRQFEIQILALLLTLAFCGQAHAGPPLEVVCTSVDLVIQILKDPNLSTPDKSKERFNSVTVALDGVFDYQEMARRALGTHWRQRTLAEQEEFVKLFRAFLERIYSDKIGLYGGERVRFGREVLDNDFAQVETTIVRSKGEEIGVVYKLRQVNAQWKVYDAVM